MRSVIWSTPCEHCGKRAFEGGKAKVGSFCATCDRKLDGAWSMAFKLPCGHEALRNAVMRTKDILICLNCRKMRDYAGR